MIRIALTLFLGLISCPKGFSSAVGTSTVEIGEHEDVSVFRVPSLQLLAFAACEATEIKAFEGHGRVKSAIGSVQEEVMSITSSFLESDDGISARGFFRHNNQARNPKFRLSSGLNNTNAGQFLDLQGFVSPTLRKTLKLYLGLVAEEKEKLFLGCLTLESSESISFPFHGDVLLKRPILHLFPLLLTMKVDGFTIKDCRMTYFPPILAQHLYITRLNIGKADFSHPSSLKALNDHSQLRRNLNHLALAQCVLPKGFSSILKDMPKLIHFFLRKTQIDGGFEGLWPNIPSSIVSLSLCSLGLTEIPTTFPSFPNLLRADFRGNAIAFYPDDFQGHLTGCFTGLYESVSLKLLLSSKHLELKKIKREFV